MLCHRYSEQERVQRIQNANTSGSYTVVLKRMVNMSEDNIKSRKHQHSNHNRRKTPIRITTNKEKNSGHASREDQPNNSPLKNISA